MLHESAPSPVTGGGVFVGTSIKTKKKSTPKKCKNYRHCRNFTPLRKSGPRKGKSKGALCYGCACASHRKNQPMRAAFHRLKSHAADRGIEFALSFEEFERFAKRTQYLTRTGPHGGALTVDRKDNLKGYVPGNIQAMTRSKNSEKRCKMDQIRMERGYAWAA